MLLPSVKKKNNNNNLYFYNAVIPTKLFHSNGLFRVCKVYEMKKHHGQVFDWNRFFFFI